MQQIPRPEYPRPSWKRDSWLNLNGEWSFAVDREKTFTPENAEFPLTIQVPFCPESSLSGIGDVTFLNKVWYQRRIEVPAEWQGKRLLLHFQAVDYDTTIWIDGEKKCFHRGCFTPITVDLGTASRSSFTVTLSADSLRDRNRPRGKQSDRLENYLCCYTRTTGIWQTVWMEAVSDVYLKRPKITPTAQGFDCVMPVSANRAGWRIQAEIGKDGEVFAAGEIGADTGLMPILHLELPADKRRFWAPEDPFLYDLKFRLVDDRGIVQDEVDSYAGWRFITIDGVRLLLNGRPVFQKLVLDQGYYPDGIWTAPTEEALIRDIRLSMDAGFNGARLHQKVFEERFLYHADKMGYMVWGEFGDWGIDWNTADQPAAGLYQPAASMIGQWIEEINRDYNHPAIIGWCGLNEIHHRIFDGQGSLDVLNDLVKAIFLAAKSADPTRPALDVSGYIHMLPESDLYDTHDYGLPQEVQEHLDDTRLHCICDPNPPDREWNEPWHGQPFFISEIGGIAWPPEAAKALTFSYGEVPQTVEAFMDRLTKLLQVIRSDKRVFGYCYTQLTDIYQEINGLYYFDRTPKFPAEILKKAQDGIAAFEE